VKERLVSALREWQQIERDAIDQAAEVMERSSNPLIREIMDIIRNDSVQHFRVQQFLIDSLVETSVSVTPEEIDAVWDALVRHEKIEKSVVAVAADLRRESTDFVQRTLLDYLLQDEKKHDRMLETLEDFRRNHYPYD
jgi:rubrerythrin